MSFWEKLFGKNAGAIKVDLDSERRTFFKAVTGRWGKGEEFYAGDAFGMVSEAYVEWYTRESIRKGVYCMDHQESAALEMLESFRIQGLLTRRVDDNAGRWYYTQNAGLEGSDHRPAAAVALRSSREMRGANVAEAREDKDAAILEAASEGNRVLAMRLYREAHGGSLAEAKRFIDD